MASMAVPPSAGAGLVTSAHARPHIVRRPTSQILSYYQSAAADAGDENSTYIYDDVHRERGLEVGNGNGPRSTSPVSEYSDDDGVIRRAGLEVRGSTLTEGPIEYGIALGTPSVLQDRPASSYLDRTPAPQRAADERHADSRQLSANLAIQAPALGHRRRKSARSSGGSDKRRIAVVEMDSASASEAEQDPLTDGQGRAQGHFDTFAFPNSSTNTSLSSSTSAQTQTDTDTTYGSVTSSSSGLLSRRGHHHHKVALLAPSDTSFSTYPNLSYFTPPLSAPPVPTPLEKSGLILPPLIRHESSASNVSATSASSSVRQHQRSQSEAVLIAGRNNPSLVSSIGIGHPITPPSQSQAVPRPGHKFRKSSRDIGIVGAHLHTIHLPPSSVTSHSEANDMQVEVRPLDEAKTHDKPQGPSSQHAQQLSPIFQRPSLSQASSYVSSTGNDGQQSTAKADPHTGVFSVFRESNRRTPAQSQSEGAENESGNGSTNVNSVGHSSRERDEQHSSNTRRQMHPNGRTSVQSSSASNGTTAPSSSSSAMTHAASQSHASTSPAASPYLHYQPGLHATAGSLPQPPRTVHSESGKKEIASASSKAHNTTTFGSAPPPRPPRHHTPKIAGAGTIPIKASDAAMKSLDRQASSSTASSHQRIEDVSTSSVITESVPTLANSNSEGSVRGKHQREGATHSTSAADEESKSHAADSSHSRDNGTDKCPTTAASDLKRKNTMEDLVKDVTAAINEASSKPLPNPAQDGHALDRESSIISSSTSETKVDNDETPKRRPAMNDRTNKPALTTYRSAMDLRREGSRSTFKGKATKNDSESDYSDSDYENITVSRALGDSHMHGRALSMSDSGHGASSGGTTKGLHSPYKILDFATAIRRFSALPRTPSRLSVSHASQHSGSNSHEHQISPSHIQTPVSAGGPPRQVHYMAKTRSRWPEAMRFNDVLAKKTSVERSLGYARKINELANHDPGLGDWVVSTKENLTRAGTKRKPASPAVSRSPADLHVFQPRHTSRGSIGSEMTFPKRVDAYIATDLLPQKGSEEELPRGPPSALPYPTLPPAPMQHSTSASSILHQPSSSRQLGLGGVRNLPASLALNRSGSGANGSAGPSTSGTSSGGGGFFSSIGRKTSIKKERPVVTGTSFSQPNKLLSRRQQTAQQPPAPRPIQISASPSLPGGPRAPPGRAPPAQRSQSVIAPKSSASALTIGLPSGGMTGGFSGAETDTEPGKKRRLSIKRSPSVQPPPIPARNTTLPPSSFALGGGLENIDAKLTKLADLLPNADRGILEGYLRRAGGSEMLAIGRYLDDEKNGVLRKL